MALGWHQQTLAEKKAADTKFTSIAESQMNQQATTCRLGAERKRTNLQLERCRREHPNRVSDPMTQQQFPNRPDHQKQAASDRMREMASSTEDKMKDVTAGAQELAGHIAEQARVYGEKAQEAAREFKPFVEKSIKEKPMQTLAGAAAIGFLLGAIWKR